MGSMLDMVGSALIFGVLLLAVGRMQGNVNSTMSQNTFNLNTQTEAVFLARLIEYDLTKAGYRVTGPKILIADSTRIAFRGALTYGGVVDSVAYCPGDEDTTTTNPRDFRLLRSTASRGALSQRLGMIYFRISYYDSLNTLMPTPVTGANRYAIRAIHIKFRVESHEPVTDAVTGEAGYFAVSWEKLIYPRNLGKPL